MKTVVTLEIKSVHRSVALAAMIMMLPGVEDARVIEAKGDPKIDV